jgi:hypothetical protein
MMRQPTRHRFLFSCTPATLASAARADRGRVRAPLDPTPDIGRAASTIGDRSGVTPGLDAAVGDGLDDVGWSLAPDARGGGS